ncbi:MAG: hypothetical protein GTO12_28430 [Proteobacteria bacterium]|nr:hypothetical protein [Pseudomonadota bacterium]
MATQEIWVHGTSGHIQEVKPKVVTPQWGTSTSEGWGLYLEGKVQNDSFENEPWVRFHIPMTSVSVEEKVHLPRLQKVMLRFRTDCNKADPNPPYRKTNRGFEKWVTDNGGAIITQLHIYDGDDRIGAWDTLDWQSADLKHSSVMSVTITPEREIRWGLGVSVRVWFKNQFFIDKRLTLNESAAWPPVDPKWDGKPWLNKEVATKTKHACLISVGCRFTPAKP